MMYQAVILLLNLLCKFIQSLSKDTLVLYQFYSAFRLLWLAGNKQEYLYNSIGKRRSDEDSCAMMFLYPYGAFVIAVKVR